MEAEIANELEECFDDFPDELLEAGHNLDFGADEARFHKQVREYAMVLCPPGSHVTLEEPALHDKKNFADLISLS